MDNREVDKKQGEYEQLEMELDEQILIIMRIAAQYFIIEWADQREAKDIWFSYIHFLKHLKGDNLSLIALKK